MHYTDFLLLCLFYWCIYTASKVKAESNESSHWSTGKGNPIHKRRPTNAPYEEIVISVADTETSRNLQGYRGINIPTAKYEYLAQVGPNPMLFSGLHLLAKHEILLMNEYTRDPTECQCQKNTDMKDCDCCAPGSCQCPKSHLCAPCDNMSYLCKPDSIDLYDAKMAVSIPVEKSRKLIVSATKKTLNIYRLVINAGSYYLIRRENFPRLNNRIAAVGYGETYSYYNYNLATRRFLILLLENSNQHVFYEWGKTSDSKGLGKEFHWSTTEAVESRNFEVFQAAAHIMVGYSVRDTLHINIFREYSGSEFRVHALQSLAFPGLVSWSYYSTEEQHLIAIFGSPFTILYQLKTQYEPFQIITHDGKNGEPLQLLFHKIYQRDSLILTIVWSCAIEFYEQQMGNGMFERLKVLTYPKCTVTSASKFDFEDSSSLVLQNDAEDPELILLSVKEPSMPNQSAKITAIMNRIKKDYEIQMASLDKIENKLKSKLTSLRLSENDAKDNRAPLNKINVDGHSYQDLAKPYYLQLMEIGNKIDKIQFFLAKSEKNIEDIVHRDGPQGLIKGDKDVKRVIAKDMVVENAYIGKAVGREEAIEDTLHKLVKIDDKRIIKGNKALYGNIRIDDFRSNYINGIDVNKIVKEDRESELDGAVFNNGLTVEKYIKIKDSQTIFGMDLSEETISLKDTAELGKCSFAKINAIDGVRIEGKRINNDHIDDLFSSSKNGEVLIYPGSTYITNLTVKGNLKAMSVMSVDVKSFLDNTINLKENERLKTVTFTDLKVTNLTTNSINGEIFPRDFVTKRSNIVDFGDKTFDQVVFGNLSVVGSINGVKTDIVVTKSTHQMISGIKTFKQGLRIFGDLNINSSKIDGIDLSFAQYESDSFHGSRTRIFNSEMTIPELRINGSVNQGQLLKAANDLAYSENGIISIYGKKIFNSIKMRNVDVKGNISSIKVSSFVNRKFENTINDMKIFVRDLSFNDIHVRNKVDGTDLDELFKYALNNNKGNQVIEGFKTVPQVTCKEIYVRGSVNGISSNDFLLKVGDQWEDRPYTFKDVVFRFLKVNKIGLPDEAKVNEFSLKNLDFDVEASSFSPTLTVLGNLAVKNGFSAITINNNKVEKLFQLLEDRRTNFFEGSVHFDYLKIDGAIMSDRLIGNVNISKLISSSVKKSGNNFISDSLWEQIEVPSIHVNGQVNKINIGGLADDVVYADKNVPYFRGVKTFLDELTVKGNLETKLINGKDLSENVLLKGKSQIISAPYSFQGIKAQNTKIGYFNNRSLRNISKIDIPKVVMNGPAVFVGHVSSRSVEVDGLVDGLDIKSTMADAVRKNASKIIMRGRKYFSQPPTFSNLHISHLNGLMVDYDTLRNRSFVTKISKLNVNGKLTANSLEATSIDVKGEIRTLMHHLVNDVKVITDPDQHLQLADVHVLGDLTVGTLNDLHVRRDLLLKNEAQTFPHHIHIEKALFKNLTTLGSINDIDMPPKIDTSNGVVRKIFTGSININEDLVINGDVTTNSLGPLELKVPGQLVLTTRPQTIPGQVNFLQPILANQVSSSSYILNDMDISPIGFPGLYTEYFSMKDYNWTSEQLKNSLQEALTLECQKTESLQKLLRHALVVPHSLKLISESILVGRNDSTPAKYRPISGQENSPFSAITPFQAFSSLWIIEANPPDYCSANVYKYDEDGHLDYYYSLDNVGRIMQFFILEQSSQSITMLIVTSVSKVCGDRGSTLWRAKAPSNKLKSIGSVYPAASAVTVDKSLSPILDIYFPTGFGRDHRYHYKNGMMNIGAEIDRNLNFSRSALLSDGSTITAKLWDGFDLKIERDEGNFSSRITAWVDDIRIIVHNGEVVLLTSITREDLDESRSYLYIGKYVGDQLKVISWINLKKPSKMLPLKMKIGVIEYNYFILLQDNAYPRVYSIKGLSVPELWQELDIHLQNGAWAEVFQEAGIQSNMKVIMGDFRKSYLLQFQLNGMSYPNKTILC